MATTITGIMQTKVISNLDTYNHTAGLTSMYTVSLKLMEQSPSGCTIVMAQNGSTKLSVAVPAATQNHVEARIVMNCTAGDLIAVTIASSQASDQTINSIKGILQITPGQY